MTVQSSATPLRTAALPTAPAGNGLAWGLLGVLAFSFTMPLTRLAVRGLDPLFVGAGRAVGAALLAGAALSFTRQPLPTRRQWWSLAVVGAGVIAGFPLLTSYALTTAPAAHGAVVIALLPAATAVAATLRQRENPGARFWILAGLGAVAALTFAAVQGGGLGALHGSDALFFGAVLAGAVGYAEGGLLARSLGAWQTISWALVLAAPVMTVLTVVGTGGHRPSATPAEWAAFGYLAAVSMFLGFVAWYRGLAIGPITRVSQIQLVQPVFTICWAALLLEEPLTAVTVAGGVLVIASAAATVRTRSGPARPRPMHAPVDAAEWP